MSAPQRIVDEWFSLWRKIDGGSRQDLVRRLQEQCFVPTHFASTCSDPRHDDAERLSRALNAALDALWLALIDGKVQKEAADRLEAEMLQLKKEDGP